jgi:hypothetical protein
LSFAGSAPPFDLFDGDRTILTPDGHSVQIVDAAAGGRVQRVPEGWLYASRSSSTRLLRFQAAAGVDIGVDGDRFVTSPDGVRIAWLSEPAPQKAALKLATLTAAAVTGVVTTPVPDDTVPVAIVGSTVVVSSPEGYDSWDSGRSAYKATGNSDVTGIFGPFGDQVVGTVRAGPTGGPDCLALLAAGAAGLGVRRRTCEPSAVDPHAANALSPDSRWLAVSTGSSVLIVDLASVFTSPSGSQGCAFDSAVRQIAWEDDTHFTVQTTTGWARCGVGVAPDRLVTEGRAGTWHLVPRAG